MNIIADTHCHTIASGHAYSTIESLIQAATQKNLYAIAITDHGRLMPGSPAKWYFKNLRAIPHKVNDVLVLRGIEANVYDYDGNLDIDPEEINDIDWVVASMHNHILPPPQSQDQCTETWLKISKNPKVNVIAHSGSELYKYDYEKVIPEFGANGKLVEINNATFNIRRDSIKNCKTIAQVCMKHSVPIVVNSDAHSSFQVGEHSKALTMLKEINFPEELIINANVNKFKNYLKKYTLVGDEII